MSNIAFLLLCCADAAWCTGAWLLLMLLPSAANAAKAALPDRETQWQWRTEQRQNVAQKLPNVSSMSSETVEKLCQTWPSCCCAVLMLHGVLVLGCCWCCCLVLLMLQRQPNVLFPGALPLASAGVGGYGLMGVYMGLSKPSWNWMKLGCRFFGQYFLLNNIH